MKSNKDNRGFKDNLYPGLYVDVRDRTNVWRVARIIDENDQSIVVCYDGFDNKSNERIYKSSARLSPFRRHTECYTGPLKETIRSQAFGLDIIENHKKRLNKMIFDSQYKLTSFEINQYLRGQLFIAIDNILVYPKKISSGELKAVHNFFQEIIAFTITYIQNAVDYALDCFDQLNNLRDTFLTNYRVAYVMALQEVLGYLILIFAIKQSERFKLYNLNQCTIIWRQRKKSENSQNFKHQDYLKIHFKFNKGIESIRKIIEFRDENSGRGLPANIRRPAFLIMKSVKSKIGLPILEMRDYPDIFKLAPTFLQIYPRTQIQQMLLQFIIGLILRQTTFQAKLKGISQLREIIQSLQQKNNANQSKQTFNEQKIVLVLRKNRFLQYIIDPNNFNFQIFKRSVMIIRFMAEQKMLKQQHINKIFNLAQLKHQSQQMLLYGTLIETAKYATIEILDHIFAQLLNLIAVPNPNGVNLIKDFTYNALQNLDRKQNVFHNLFNLKKSSSKYGFYGVDYFWHEIQEESKNDAQTILLYLDALKKLFAKQVLWKIREVFVQNCINNMKKKKSFAQSLKFFMNILMSYPLKANGEKRPEAVKKFDKKYNIMDLIMLNLKGDQTEKVKVSKFSLIQTKQWFFQFLQDNNQHLKNGIRVVTVKNMWIPDTEDTTPLLKYLGKIQQNPKDRSRKQYYKQLPLDSIKQLFEEIFLSNNLMKKYKNMTIDVYQCIDQLFLSFHYCSRSIDISQNGIVRIVNPKQQLCFIQFYQNVLQAENQPNVFNSARKRIVQLHIRMRDSNDLEKKVSMWIQYFDKLLQLLMKKQRKILQILLELLIQIEGKTEKGDIGRDVIIDLKVIKTDANNFASKYQQNPNDEQRTIKISKNSTIFKLRKQIMKEYKIDTDFHIELIENHKDFTFNEEQQYTVAFIEIPYKGPSVRFLKKNTVHTHFEALSTFRQYLSNNSDLYTTLIKMLDQQKENVLLIWKILDILPKNKHLYNKLINQPFSKLQWEQFLKTPQQETFRYKLKIIFELCSDKYGYINLFKSTGGFSVLISKLPLIINFEQKINQHSAQCFELILDIMNVILSIHQKQLIDEINLKELVNNVKQFIGHMNQNNQKIIIINKILRVLINLAFLSEDKIIMIEFHQDIKLIESIIIESISTKNSQLANNFISTFSEVYIKYTNSKDRLQIISFLTQNFLNYDTNKSPPSHAFTLLIQLIKNLDDQNQKYILDENSPICQLLLTYPLKILLQEKLQQKQSNEFNTCIYGALCIEKLIILKRGFDHNRHAMLFQILIQQFLFHQSNNRVKSHQNIQVIYLLLQVLLKINPDNIKSTSDFLQNKLKLGDWRNLRDWTIDNQPVVNNVQKKISFCGLKNLSSTCYMNCLLQQFYSIEFFREAIIKVNVLDFNKKIDQNWMYQLQRIFTFLKHTSKGSYNPKDFCAAFRDYQNKPIDVRVQSDADQFFNMFLDKLQNFLKQINQIDILESTFKGLLINQVSPQAGCNHKSERQENFLSLRINIKNNNSLQSALQTHFDDEVLSGQNAYHCSVCNNKFPARKRQIIKNLPNSLVIALKRFQFNYDTMKKIKINDYCAFPLQGLDMKRFSKEVIGRAPEYYLYDLRGVVVHYGMADSGHYYSYIKRQDQWIEFNDEVVLQFDKRMFESECFGGVQKFGNQFESERCKNAYILFYERRVFFDKNEQVNQFPIQLNQFNQSRIIQQAIKDNRSFQFTKKVFEPSFLNFGLMSFQIGNQQGIRLGFILFHNVVLYSAQKQKLLIQYCQRIQEILQDYSIAEWYLNQINAGFIKQFLIEAPKPIKYIMVGIIRCAIKSLDGKLQKISNIVAIFVSCLQKKGMTPFCKIFGYISETYQGKKLLDKYDYVRRIVMHLCTDQKYAIKIDVLQKFSFFGEYEPRTAPQPLQFCNISMLDSLKEFTIEKSDIQLMLQNISNRYAYKILSEIAVQNSYNEQIYNFGKEIQNLTKKMKNGDMKEIQFYVYQFKQFLSINDNNHLVRVKEIVKSHIYLLNHYKTTYYPFQFLLKYLCKFSFKYLIYRQQLLIILESDPYYLNVIEKWIEDVAKAPRLIYHGEWTFYKKKNINAISEESNVYYERKSKFYTKVFNSVKFGIDSSLELFNDSDEQLVKQTNQINKEEIKLIRGQGGQFRKMTIIGKAGLLYRILIDGVEKWMIIQGEQKQFLKRF